MKTDSSDEDPTNATENNPSGSNNSIPLRHTTTMQNGVVVSIPVPFQSFLAECISESTGILADYAEIITGRPCYYRTLRHRQYYSWETHSPQYFWMIGLAYAMQYSIEHIKHREQLLIQWLDAVRCFMSQMSAGYGNRDDIKSQVDDTEAWSRFPTIKEFALKLGFEFIQILRNFTLVVNKYGPKRQLAEFSHVNMRSIDEMLQGLHREAPTSISISGRDESRFSSDNGSRSKESNINGLHSSSSSSSSGVGNRLNHVQANNFGDIKSSAYGHHTESTSFGGAETSRGVTMEPSNGFDLLSTIAKQASKAVEREFGDSAEAALSNDARSASAPDSSDYSESSSCVDDTVVSDTSPRQVDQRDTVPCGLSLVPVRRRREVISDTVATEQQLALDGPVRIRSPCRRKRFRYMAYSQHETGFILAPKGIFFVDRGCIRVQLTQQDMSMKKFSRNIPTLSEAMWLYEIAILLSDAPKVLSALIENGNYETLVELKAVHSPVDYFLKLGKVISLWRTGSCGHLTSTEADMAIQLFNALVIDCEHEAPKPIAKQPRSRRLEANVQRPLTTELQQATHKTSETYSHEYDVAHLHFDEKSFAAHDRTIQIPPATKSLIDIGRSCEQWVTMNPAIPLASLNH